MQRFVILLLMGLVIGIPFALRPTQQKVDANPDERLIIITPHNESIRYEFNRGFQEWYREKTGKTVYIDWRVPGGTSEINKFINSEYVNAFRNYWTDELGREWNTTVAEKFNNPSVELDETPKDDTLAQQARRTFLNSDVSNRLDLFFGGGAYYFGQQAKAGHLVPSGILKKRPERFTREIIPHTYKGETFYDKRGRWVGTALSTFGILYNKELVQQADVPHPPKQWKDLTDHAYFAQLGVSDPTKSGSIAAAFEMIVQQHMQEAMAAAVERTQASEADELDNSQRQRALATGWADALQTIQAISANARYFTESASKPVIDVSQGNCAVGMCIDFYGRYQEENIANRTNGQSRVLYATPQNGSSVSADPIGLFRGAPNSKVALAFIDYVTSIEGQKLWDYRKGTPGGPELYTLRRPPIRRDLYTPKHRQYFADKEVNPYHDTGDFIYHPEWTGSLFNPMRFIIRTAFIDPHDELAAARRAIIRARREGRTASAKKAGKVFHDLSKLSYENVFESIRPALKGKKIEEVRLAKKLGQHFRNQYQKARRLANE